MNETTPEFDSMVETPPPNIPPQAIIPMEVINMMVEQEGIIGKTKTMGILRSVSAIVSIVASAVLIWMIMRSKKRLTTPYHRILLGMSIADIVFSMSNSHFNALSAKDLAYLVWNVRGNLVTCVTTGFLSMTGQYCSMFYAVSLNIYFLLVVKYNKKDKEIYSKYEKWLHGIPIGLALLITIPFVSTKHYNPGPTGTCTAFSYEPPHCNGFEKGDVREGFEIPCYRGVIGDPNDPDQIIVNDDDLVPDEYRTDLAELIGASVKEYVINFGVPIIILSTLAMLYLFVKKQENKMTRYGAGALDIANSEQPADNSRVSSGATSIASRITSSLSSSLRLKKAARNNNAKSRSFLTRGLLFSVSYFLTYGWTIVMTSLAIDSVAKGCTCFIPDVVRYLNEFFIPLQGLFNFLIFLYPKVVDAKRKGKDISWCGALVKVFYPEANVSKFSKQASTKTSVLTQRSTGIGSSYRKSSRQEVEEEKEEVDEEIQEEEEEKEEVDEEIQE